MPKLGLHILEKELIIYYKNLKNTEFKEEYQSQEDHIQSAIKEFVNYFMLYDKIEGTIHAQIISELYSQAPKNINLDKICRNNSIYERTLYRYRKKYIKVLEIIIQKKK